MTAEASSADVDKAIAAARRVFDITGWSTNHASRIKLIKDFYGVCVVGSECFSDIVR